MVHSNMIETSPQTRLEARRARVAEAARALFSRHGFHATGIAQIAEVSGIKVQQIYRDFANKEAIVAHIAEQDVGELFATLSQLESRSGTGRDELRARLRSLLALAFTTDEPPLFLEIFAEGSRNPRIATILQALDAEVRTTLVSAFMPFAAPGTDPAQLATVADLFLVFVSGVSERRIGNPRVDIDRLIEMMSGILVDQIPM